MKMRFLGEAVLALILSTAIASAQQASDTVAPEKATDVATARRVEFEELHGGGGQSAGGRGGARRDRRGR